MSRAFLIFTGTNSRAWTTLALFFDVNNVPFYLIARDKSDICFQTAFGDRVLYVRKHEALDPDDVAEIGASLEKAGIDDGIICPTSEYLNRCFFNDESLFLHFHMRLAAASSSVYNILSDKKTSYAHFLGSGLSIAQEMAVENISYPCVAKPKKNFLEGKILYPQFLQSSDDFKALLKLGGADAYFYEQYLDGQSYYLCFYFRENGQVEAYAQKNLAQQPRGKSIVAAVPSDIHTTDVAQHVLNRFKALKYRGPAMVELYQFKGQWYFIEVNPRFWGPLRLSLYCRPQMLAAFVEDWLGLTCLNYPTAPREYIWYKGAMDFMTGLRLYGDAIKNPKSYFEDRIDYDVFNHTRTKRLAFKS